MFLVAEGYVDLAADIADYLAEFSEQYVNIDGKRTPVSRRITVRDLLNMTSGIPYPDDTTPGGRQSGNVFWQIDNRLYSDNPVTTEEFSRMMAGVGLCFEPGARFMYGASADILGAMVERVSGMKFGEYLKTKLFDPLGMQDTGFYVPAGKAHRLAKVYDNKDGLVEVKTNHLGLRYMRDIPPAFESGGAGLCSTVDDYAKFATMLLQNGAYDGKQIMPVWAVKYMTHGGLTEGQKPGLSAGWDWMQGYTYGNLMRVCDDESQTTLFSHKGEYGWDGWLGSFFSNEPSLGITLLMGVQQVGVGQTGTLVRKLKNVVMSDMA